MRTDLGRLAAAISGVGRGSLLVVTGAGVSYASGIPTFRGTDPGAVWRKNDVELATFDYFRRDPAGHWRWYLERFRLIAGVRPNPAHRALAALERWQTGRGGRFDLVTQNIDTLHADAGSSDPIQVHGTSARVRCSRWRCRLGSPAGSLARGDVDFGPFAAEPVTENIPLCPECGSLLRAHILLFDELYSDHRDYRYEESIDAAERAELMLFVGTSFAVGITDMFLRAGRGRRVPMVAVDPAGHRAPGWAALEVLQAPAEEALPELVAALESGG